MNKKKKEELRADETIKGAFAIDDKELVKFINSVFKTNYNPNTAKVVHLTSEHIRPRMSNTEEENITFDTLYADMTVSIDGNIYGLEFQTKHDNKMIIRVLEYKFHNMLNQFEKIHLEDKFKIEIELPSMSVIQLEESKNVEDKYIVLYVNKETKEKLRFEYPIIKLWEYDLKTLIDTDKKMLIPFSLLKYRKLARNNELDVETTKDFIKSVKLAHNTLFKLIEDEKTSTKAIVEWGNTTNYIAGYINNNFIKKDNPLKGEVENMIAGYKEVKYYSYVGELEENAFNQGIKQERQRTEQERQRTEQERQRAEQERQRANKLEEEKRKSAKEMIKDGLKLEVIEKYTNLSESILKELENEVKSEK